MAKKQDSKKPNTSYNQFIITTLVSILVGILGIVLGSYTDILNTQSNNETASLLEDKKFEYSIIENALSQEKYEQKVASLEFAINIGLISAIDTTALKKIIDEQKLPDISRNYEGFIDGLTMTDILWLIQGFYEENDRVPYNSEELDSSFRMDLHYKILGKDKVRYQAVSEENFRLVFAFNDDELGTADDKIYEFKDLPMNK